MTEAYAKILAAVDLADDSPAVVARAHAIARASGAELVLLHVIEYHPTGSAQMPTVPMTAELEAHARTRFDALAARIRLDGARQIVCTGPLRDEILRVAREESVDLLVLGNRERHGLAVILNLTEDTVLQAAPCDVLGVRLSSD